MIVERRLSFMQRLLARVLNYLQEKKSGYDTPFVEEWIRTAGTKGFFEHAQRLEATINAATELYGATTAQMLISLAALWNGCWYCGVGHMFAANLQLFRDEKVLGPLDEREVPAIGHLTDEEALARLLEIFAETRFERMRALMQRQYAIKTGTAEGTTPDDDALLAILTAWDILNEASITSGIDLQDPAIVPPLCDLAKDRQLRAEYRAARKEAAGAAGSSGPNGPVSA